MKLQRTPERAPVWLAEIFATIIDPCSKPVILTTTVSKQTLQRILEHEETEGTERKLLDEIA
jgi:hypothetical protein